MDSTPDPETRPRSTASPNLIRKVEEHTPESTSYPMFERPSGLDALSSAAVGNFDYIRTLSIPARSPNPDTHITPPVSNNLNFILNPSGPDLPPVSTPVDPALLSPQLPQPVPQNDANTVLDHEVSFLLRHFGEITGQWMDLFDLGCYFGQLVPVQALTNPLLKYSACAYAAKQLGRVDGRKAVIGGIVSKQAEMELYPQPGTADWSYISAKYYDKAISLLMEELSNSGVQEMPLTPIVENAVYTPRSGSHASPVSAQSRQDGKRRRLSRGRSSHTTNADETLAAAAILCVYEFLDNANTAWARHLSGTKSLFDMAENEGMMPVQSPTSPGAVSQRIKPSRGRKATFWNFARQDFLAACKFPFLNLLGYRCNVLTRLKSSTKVRLG